MTCVDSISDDAARRDHDHAALRPGRGCCSLRVRQAQHRLVDEHIAVGAGGRGVLAKVDSGSNCTGWHLGLAPEARPGIRVRAATLGAVVRSENVGKPQAATVGSEELYPEFDQAAVGRNLNGGFEPVAGRGRDAIRRIASELPGALHPDIDVAGRCSVRLMNHQGPGDRAGVAFVKLPYFEVDDV